MSDGNTPLKPRNSVRDSSDMTYLSSEEFARMEQLLADLLPHVNQAEEVALLHLHTRLCAINAAQSGLQSARTRLTALQSQTV